MAPPHFEAVRLEITGLPNRQPEVSFPRGKVFGYQGDQIGGQGGLKFDTCYG